MPTFVLKKYTEQKPDEQNVDQDKPPEVEKKEEKILQIRTTDTISEIVARALYKALGQNVTIEEKPDEASETNVISAEDINKSPVDCLNRISNNTNVLIVAEMFKTQKESWFLSTLINKNVRAFYTVESFINHIKKELGVKNES